MEGDKETESRQKETEGDDDECSFVWDDANQLYFHSRSGFYYDPNAGWYYSSRDGVYYKFENGTYVLLENTKINECESDSCPEIVPDNRVQRDSSTQATQLYSNSKEHISSLPTDQSDVCTCSETVPHERTPGDTECCAYQEAQIPHPQSTQLEETFNNFYLSGYKHNAYDADMATMSFNITGASHNGFQMLENGDRISEQHDSVLDEVSCGDEENWLAQYGQVVHSGKEPLRDLRVVDLWEWGMVKGSRKDGKGYATRLVGHLVRRSAKLHPSMPSGGGLFRTAPICEARLDLVRVRSGQVYKLHSPSARYLATLTSYDSCNPTKDWGFPELSINVQAIPTTKYYVKSEPELADEDIDKGLSVSPNELSTSKKQRIHEYRDRAAERRTLHGGFGVGPGQKSSSVDDVFSATSPVPTSREEAAAEALNMSFGAGSYARKILENMGWKEGEALGNTRKGVIEPIQAIGNMGSAGLGWSQGNMRK